MWLLSQQAVDTSSLGPFAAFGGLAILSLSALAGALRWAIRRVEAAEARTQEVTERLIQQSVLNAALSDRLTRFLDSQEHR